MIKIQIACSNFQYKKLKQAKYSKENSNLNRYFNYYLIIIWVTTGW